MAKFGDLIQRYRIDGDKTLESAADLLGVSAAYLSEVELGRRPPFTRTRVEKLAAFYNADPEPLIEQACRERGFVELDMAHVSSLQLKIILGLAHKGLSEDQWAEIYRIVTRERREDKKSPTGLLKLAALATATAK
jgi:transcriptional regulator with XRE-family HTH domain